MNKIYDIAIVGAGASGLTLALSLPDDFSVVVISKEEIDEGNSYLAQGGISCLLNDDDYEAYFKDTMKAGHYENDEEAVSVLIKNSKDAIAFLLENGVEFDKDADGEYQFAREGGHSVARIYHHKDITGKEIMRALYEKVKTKKNIQLVSNCKMTDIVFDENIKIVCEDRVIEAKRVCLATGGVGGLYKNSTSFRSHTGDSIKIALEKGIETKDLDYIQIHPTAFYEDTDARRFLISEALRGSGAILLNKDGERFADELLPRDKLTKKIEEQMEKDGTDFVWLDATAISPEEIDNHFPNIRDYCSAHGYDIKKERFPVAPAQHYFMGGIKVDTFSRTSVPNLYAIGETACTGVHGKNRLASNSLLEAVVFARRAAEDICK